MRSSLRKLTKFPHSEQSSVWSTWNQNPENLPNLPPSILKRVLDQIGPQDLRWIMQHRLLPLISLPEKKLYADLSPRSAPTPTRQMAKIVAIADPAVALNFIQSTHGPYLKSIATDKIKTTTSDYSAHTRLTSAQTAFALSFGLIGLYANQFLALGTLLNLITLAFSVLFFGMIWLRLVAIFSKPPKPQQKFNRADEDLPIYTVLVPVFRETAVLPQLLHALSKLNYPKTKLDIKLILEEKDFTMRNAVQRLHLPPEIEVLVVPEGKPQTKPRALNYALTFAKGDLLTIYDAEDIPEPMQLRLAAAEFAIAPHHIACLQAELAFYNSNENWLTRQFAIEYATLFRLVLPALAQRNLPLPLGGTSNHFRTEILEQVGGWDPYNVTEDADLGFRLARLGFSSQTLHSITYEEANTQVKNWLHQRSRWLKGFLITWLVHMRAPLKLIGEIGFKGFATLQITMIGVLLTAILHPVFLAATVIKFTASLQAETRSNFLELTISGAFFAYFIIGIVIMMWSGKSALGRKMVQGWWFSILTMPAYWLLASLAGWIALWQFITAPFAWNKTKHGISKFQEKPSLGLGQNKN